MISTTTTYSFKIRSKDFIHTACYMTIQLPCLRKDIAAFPFNVVFIWGGMSYMVIGGVALGCTEYQTHNVVGITENRFVWTIESHYHIKGHLSGASEEKVPSNLVILLSNYMVNMITTILLYIECHMDIEELCLYKQWNSMFGEVLY